MAHSSEFKSKLNGTDLIHVDDPLSSSELGPSISVTSSESIKHLFFLTLTYNII